MKQVASTFEALISPVTLQVLDRFWEGATSGSHGTSNTFSKIVGPARRGSLPGFRDFTLDAAGRQRAQAFQGR